MLATVPTKPTSVFTTGQLRPGGIAFPASSFRLQAAGSGCGGGPKTSPPVAAMLTGALVAAALQSF